MTQAIRLQVQRTAEKSCGVNCALSIAPRQARTSGLRKLQGSMRQASNDRDGPRARVRGCPAPFPAPGLVDRREEPETGPSLYGGSYDHTVARAAWSALPQTSRLWW